MNSQVCAVILAAGEGKRMQSDSPKVMCRVLFKPMVEWVADAVAKSGISSICTVTGYGSDIVISHLRDTYKNTDLQLSYSLQQQRLGTGHAVARASDFLSGFCGGHTLILCGDAPFMSKDDIEGALKCHLDGSFAATVISAKLPNPSGYGRILRDGGNVAGIMEEKDATPEQKRIDEVNSGAYWFQTDELLSVLGSIQNNNAQGEYYLTDAIGILISKGKKVGSYIASPDAVLGANDKKTLAKLNEIARDRVIERHMEGGVEIFFKDGVIIGPDVIIGEGTGILPGTILKGKTVIGRDCTIGPNSLIEDCTVGDGSNINASQCYQSTLGIGVRMGPFSQLRPNSTLDDYVKIGNFVEIKNSKLGHKTSVAHLTYVGDSDVGSRVNFGCGCVTVNYDGVTKARCTVGDDCFIGCNTNLIAPVKIGNGAYTAAGTTVTGDVPEGALAIGRAKQEIKPDWARRKMKDKKAH